MKILLIVITLFLLFSPSLVRAAPSNFVSVNNGDFYLNGQKFYPFGTNYFPSYYNLPNYQILPQSGLAQNFLHSPYYETHLTLLEKELSDMENLGFNVISIQAPPRDDPKLPNPKALSNFYDFLNRAKNHRLKVSLYLRNCDPLILEENVWQYFDLGICLDQLRELNLASNDTVFAYEIGWEISWGTQDYQRNALEIQKAWTEWTIERYGSLENAKTNWNYSDISIPTEYEMSNEGSWSTKVKAYTRFINDWVGQLFNPIVREIKKVDPNHLVTARTPDWMIVPAAAREFDFVSLEGWRLPIPISQGATKFFGNGFVVGYAKHLSQNKPVVFYEFGESTLPLNCQAADMSFNPECYQNSPISSQQSQAFYYQIFYDMALKSDTKGVLNWLYVGKRPFKNTPWSETEISDYGIREVPNDDSGNQLGNQKLAYETVGQNRQQFVQNRSPMVFDDTIVIDQDNYSGLSQFYVSGASQFSQKIAAGKLPQVKTPGSGTNSENAPRVCVGNTPLNGSCPHKYLNAQLSQIEVQNSTGQWQEATNGLHIGVKSGQPVQARVLVRNSGESTWLAQTSGGNGIIQIGGNENAGSIIFQMNIPADIHPNEEVLLGSFAVSDNIVSPKLAVFQMAARNLFWFGQQIHIYLDPVSIDGQVTVNPTSISTPTVIPTSVLTQPPSDCFSTKSKGDADCDGLVNNDDYKTWLSSQCRINCAETRADFDGNGKVDDEDFRIWNSHKIPG